MSTYRVFEVAEPGRLVINERELENPGPGQVRIAVEACGVCHSDVLAVAGLVPGHQGRVPGHEIVGRISALGDGVLEWAVGDRVGVGYLGGACGECDRCRLGDPAGCTRQHQTGTTVDGGYAESMLASVTGLVRLPEDGDAVALAPLLCAGLTTLQALEAAQIRPGAVVAVQGLGGLGHLAVQYAVKLGFDVVAIARGEEKRQLAAQLGARHYINSSSEDVAAALQNLGGAETIIATASSGASMSPLVPGLSPQGTLVVVGAAPDPISVDTGGLIFGRRKIMGTLTGTPVDAERTIRFSLDHSVEAWTEEYPFEQAQQAYDHMMSGDARFRAVLRMS